MSKSSKDRKLPYRHRYKLILSIGYSEESGAVDPSTDSFYSEDAWNELTRDEQKAWLDEFASDWAKFYIDISWIE